MEIKQIIKEFKNNDRSHFNIFYEETKRQVFFSAYSIIKDHQLAEDILQETYINFLNNIDAFNIYQNVYSYLSTIARNIAINVYNKNKRIHYNDEYLTNLKDDYISTDKDVDIILNLLEDEIEKEIVTYHIILEYKFNEISKIINKPLGTTLWLYNKAMKKLKERIGEIYE